MIEEVQADTSANWGKCTEPVSVHLFATMVRVNIYKKIFGCKQSIRFQLLHHYICQHINPSILN